MMSKELLRKELREKRNLLSEKETKSQKIVNRLLETEAFSNAEVVMLYRSAKGEVGTDSLWEACKQAGKVCVFPKCVSDSEMIAVMAQEETDFTKSSFGIMEPASEQVFPKELIDLIVVPALGYDQSNFRMGYGGGYYDRYLEDFYATTVGLCFEELLVETVYPGVWDVPVDFVVTESDVYSQ